MEAKQTNVLVFFHEIMVAILRIAWPTANEMKITNGIRQRLKRELQILTPPFYGQTAVLRRLGSVLRQGRFSWSVALQPHKLKVLMVFFAVSVIQS